MKRVIVAAVILVMGFAVSVMAEEKVKTVEVKKEKITIADSKDIEQKKAAIMKIMSRGQFKAYIQDDKKFCSEFLEDFKTQKNIEHIKPIVETDDYNDPKLQAYFKRCPNKKFHKVTDNHSHTLQEIADRERSLGRALSEEELKEYESIDFYATKNFKLYKVNIDNNAKNSDEYILYAEDFYNEVINQYDISGAYVIIDFKKCKDRGGFIAGALYDYKKQQPIEEYNGIIKYKGKYYIFRLYKVYKDPVQNSLILEEYSEKLGIMNSIKIARHTICNYNEKTFMPSKKKNINKNK